MPSTSEAQKRFMAGVAHGMKPKGGDGPSVKVAKEFNKADQMAQAHALRQHADPSASGEPDGDEPHDAAGSIAPTGGRGMLRHGAAHAGALRAGAAKGQASGVPGKK